MSGSGFLVVAALLFAIGVAGLLIRRSVVVILMSVELIANAVALNLVTFSRMHGNLNGQAFALLLIGIAAAEAALALAILIALYRNRGTVLADEIDLLRW